MDLARMLDKCVRDQWSIDDLDWRAAPPALSPDKEAAIVQYFTDMSGIERLAGALFAAQQTKTADPTLRKIFATFVVDEKRHAAVAARLAQHYDVHHLRPYRESAALTAFRPHFLRVIELAAPEVANAYITAGELMLDIALLRSLDDYVGDAMSHRAMVLINRDESRHLAIDFHMTETYASPAFRATARARTAPSLAQRARSLGALAAMLWHAQPFFRDVFVTPMDRTDPDGTRLREALKRAQLLLRKPTVAQLPFSRFILAAQTAFNRPLIGAVFGRPLLRILGADARAATILFTADELARSQRMSFAELADDALAVKEATGVKSVR